MNAAARFAVLIGFTGLPLGAAIAQQCSGPNLEDTADRCFATPGCDWNKTHKVCEGDQSLQNHNGDERFIFDGNQVHRNRDGVVTQLPFQVNRQNLDRVCPNALLRTFRELNLRVDDVQGGPDAQLGSPSLWLTWDFGVERTLKMREAWLSLRHLDSASSDGACHTALLRATIPQMLAMSKQAETNWKLARQGNPFLGLIDCRDWKIYLIPTQARDGGAANGLPQAARNQLSWTVAQLKKAQWVANGFFRSSAAPRDLTYHATRGVDHGWAALKVSGLDEDGNKSFAAFCKVETKVKSNFLGFTVWADANGKPYFVHSSRQLNGPNLDQYDLDHEAPDGWILPGTRLVDGAGNSVLKPDGKLLDNLVPARGLLTPELQRALERLGATMSDRPF